MMSQIDRYSEEGSPIYAPDSGQLGIVWEAIGHIQNENSGPSKSAVNTFSMDEFFKRLYMARAELDICTSTLDLLDKADPNNIQFTAAAYQKREGNKFSGEGNAFAAKIAAIAEVTEKLKKKASNVRGSTAIEHGIVTNKLLKLVEIYRWTISRVSHARQISMYFDPAEVTPIAVVNFSPKLLFKSSGERYLPAEAQNPQNLAIIFRDCNDQLMLKLQDPLDLFKKSLVIQIGEDKCTIDFSVSEEQSSDDVESWNRTLSKAQYFLLMRLVLDSIQFEATKSDIVLKDDTDGFKVANRNVSFSWCQAPASNSNPRVSAVFEAIIMSFLNSDGKKVNYELFK